MSSIFLSARPSEDDKVEGLGLGTRRARPAKGEPLMHTGEKGDRFGVERSALSANISRLSREGAISAYKRHFILKTLKGTQR